MRLLSHDIQADRQHLCASMPVASARQRAILICETTLAACASLRCQQPAGWADADIPIRVRLLQLHKVSRFEHEHLKKPAAGVHARLALNQPVQADAASGLCRTALQPPLLLARCSRELCLCMRHKLSVRCDHVYSSQRLPVAQHPSMVATCNTPQPLCESEESSFNIVQSTKAK